MCDLKTDKKDLWKSNSFRFSELHGLLSDYKPPLYRRLMPWLPICWKNESLNTVTFMLFDCSVTHKSLTKKHSFELLICNHRNWWTPKYVGFCIWMC